MLEVILGIVIGFMSAVALDWVLKGANKPAPPPVMKRRLGIVSCNERYRCIWFNTDKGTRELLSVYGVISHLGDKYSLWVDARYDFDEVFNYVKGLESPSVMTTWADVIAEDDNENR